MLILDKARAMDLLIANAERVRVPDQFVLSRSHAAPPPVIGIGIVAPSLEAPSEPLEAVAPGPQPFRLRAA